MDKVMHKGDMRSTHGAKHSAFPKQRALAKRLRTRTQVHDGNPNRAEQTIEASEPDEYGATKSQRGGSHGFGSNNPGW